MERDDTDATVVRRQHIDCAGPVEVWVDLEGGQVDVQLSASTDDAATVTVQIQPDLRSRARWSAGITGILTWLGEQSAPIGPSAELAAEATRSTMIDFTGQRLIVQTPRAVPLRSVPLIIQVTAPSGSSVIARSSSADLTVDGVADRMEVTTGSGQIRAQRCTGAVDVRTGSGDVRLGSVLGTLRVRTGSGLVDVVSLESESAGTQAGTVQTGSGDVRFGSVARDVTAHTGTGDLTIVDAAAGELELTSGSGQLRVGIHPGVLAELDVSSGFGKAHSELPISGPPAEGRAGLRVRARTGSGDALVTAAPR